jgi:hypothetical protein
MIRRGLSVDISGYWTHAQVQAVLKIVQLEAKQMGLEITPVDVTPMGSEIPRFLLIAYCLHHHVAVALNEVCIVCVGKRYD